MVESLDRRGFLGAAGAAAAAGLASTRLHAGSSSSDVPREGAGPGGPGSPGTPDGSAGVLAAAGVCEGAKFGTCTVLGVSESDDGAIAVSLSGIGWTTLRARAPRTRSAHAGRRAGRLARGLREQPRSRRHEDRRRARACGDGAGGAPGSPRSRRGRAAGPADAGRAVAARPRRVSQATKPSRVRAPARAPVQRPLRLLRERTADAGPPGAHPGHRDARRAGTGGPRGRPSPHHVPRGRTDAAAVVLRDRRAGRLPRLRAHRHLLERLEGGFHRPGRSRPRDGWQVRVALLGPGRDARCPRTDDGPQGRLRSGAARALDRPRARSARDGEPVPGPAELRDGRSFRGPARPPGGLPGSRRHAQPVRHRKGRRGGDRRDDASLHRRRAGARAHGPRLPRGLRREPRKLALLHCALARPVDPPRSPADDDRHGQRRGRARPQGAALPGPLHGQQAETRDVLELRLRRTLHRRLPISTPIASGRASCGR